MAMGASLPCCAEARSPQAPAAEVPPSAPTITAEEKVAILKAEGDKGDKAGGQEDRDLRAELDAAFKKWDANGDGALSPQEIEEVLATAGMSKAEIGDILAVADANKDGKVDYQEFCNWIVSKPPAAGGVASDSYLAKLRDAGLPAGYLGLTQDEAGLQQAPMEEEVRAKATDRSGSVAADGGQPAPAEAPALAEDAVCSPVLSGLPAEADLIEMMSKQEDFALAKHCLERWPEDKLAVRTCGANLVGEERTFTYGDLRQAAYFGADLMYRHGVRLGDKVLLLQWNSWECVAAYWSAQYVGAACVMATPTHVTRKYLIKYSACKAIVAVHGVWEALRPEIDDRTHVSLVLMTDVAQALEVEGLYGEFNRSPCTVDADMLDDSFDVVGEDPYQVLHFDATGRAAAMSEEVAAEFAKVRRETPQSWYFTSGTTGKPKGCVHKQVDLAWAAETYARQVMGLGEGVTTATDVLMVGPYAMGSNMVFPFALGGAIFLDHINKLDLSDLPRVSFPILRKSKPDIFVTIPGTIQELSAALAAEPDEELLASLQQTKVITSAGAPVAPSAYCNFRFAARQCGLNAEVLDGVGTSELQHIFITNHAGDVRSDRGGIGTLVVGYEAKLLNAKSSDTDTGKRWTGELAVRTQVPDIQVEYANGRPPRGVDFARATQEAVAPAEDGGAPFYITGDMAMAEQEGDKWYFSLLGRTKDLFSMLSSQARGMGVDDYKRRCVATAVMFKAGLLEKCKEIGEALGCPEASEPFANDVYPVLVEKADAQTCVLVVSVSSSYWPADAQKSLEDLEPWSNYLAEAVGNPEVSVAGVFFAPESSIPRTPPPLLKPKVGDMKKLLQDWVDQANPVLDQAALLKLASEWQMGHAR